jgi:predicted Zn-dependent protease
MLAHEIGHVSQNHFSRAKARVEAQEKTQTALGVAAAVAGVVPFVGPFIAAGMTATQVVAPVGFDLGAKAFSRGDETEADEFAARLMSRLGGPRACLVLAALFDHLAREGSTAGGWLSSHPDATSRAAATRAICQSPPS